MTSEDRGFPPALAAVAGQVSTTGHGGPDHLDYEPFTEFLSAAETTEWFRLWTGNPEADGDHFRIFGTDGTGGYVGFWLGRPGAKLATQPVVYLGSEGETAVIAGDLGGFLWLLADGVGPWHAADRGMTLQADPATSGVAYPGIAAIAEHHAPQARRGAREIVVLAAGEFPDFPRVIDGLCR